MDDTRSIVIVGGEDGNLAKLITQIEPIRLSENKGLAIKSIFHGTVCNINKNNNKVHYKLKYAENFETKYFEIPEGNYPDSVSILTEISDIISKLDPDGAVSRKPRFEVTIRARINAVKISVHNISIVSRYIQETPWNLLGITSDIHESSSVEVDKLDFTSWMMPSFLYVNIVENSYINGKLSRNLSTIPLNLKRGWSYYEFENPIYIPVDVKEFSKIVLELRDMNGDYVCFNSNYKTIATLHLKPI